MGQDFKKQISIFTRIRKNLGLIFGNICQNWSDFPLFTEERIQILIMEMKNEFRDVEQYTPLLGLIAGKSENTFWEPRE